MLKFLSLNSSAAVVQGTQLHRATGSTFAYLWQKADEKSCEPTNHNPSLIKQLENGAWHGVEETRAIQAAAGYCSNLLFPTARVTSSKLLMRQDFPQGSLASFSSSQTSCSSGISFYWLDLAVCPALYYWVADSQGRRFKIHRGKAWFEKWWIPEELLHHQMDPNSFAVYYDYRFPSRQTLGWQLTT